LLNIDQLSTFVIIMFLMLILPRLFEKIKLPGLIGLLLSGFILGPKAFDVLHAEQETLKFLSAIGKLMVMFFAGLEINFDQFSKHWKRSILFGSLTFSIPLAIGCGISLAAGLSWVSAVLVGSLLASHTLVGFVILQKKGLLQKRAVTSSIGATIFTDIAALMVLALCVSIFTTGFDLRQLGLRTLGMLIYFPTVLFGCRFIATKMLARMHDNEEHRILLMVLIMGLAAIGAELIHLEAIVGAFVSGLAVGGILRNGKTKEQLETLGNTLFIPMFFLTIGTLIDPMSFTRMHLTDLAFSLAIVAGLIGAKAAAAFLSAKLLGFSRAEGAMMWSLSMPQVAATLAAALVAYETVNSAGERLISEVVLDTALLLMAVTTILGPILTEKYAPAIRTTDR
jgi:Kef-type K+ transport system membrane component KefB